MIKKALISLLAASILFAAGCGNSSTSSTQATPAKVARVKTNTSAPAASVKQVSVFDLSKDKATVEFYKTAVAASEGEVLVSPETAGKVVQVNVKVGDKVKKGQTLVVLGDSVSTKIADIQNNTASQSLELAKKSQTLTDQSTEQSWEMAYLGTEGAQKTFANSATSQRDAASIYQEQIDSAEIGLDMAQDAYDAAKDAYSAFDDMTPEQQQQMGGDSGVTLAKKSAKNGVRQAENGIDILEKTFVSQTHQMDYGIQMALIGYKNAIHQLQLAQIGMGQQQIGASMQVLQAESGAQMAQVSANSKYIKAPIDGVVSSLSAEKGNTLAPGMPAFKIENSQNLLIDVALNLYEATLIKVGDNVKVDSSGNISEGKVLSISPSANSMTKKINLEVLIQNPKNIVPGTFVKITFASSAEGRIFVPLNAVYNMDEGQFVKTVEGDKIALKKVEMSEITGAFVEIKSGLNGTEKIVTNSDLFLDEGEKVHIANN